MKKIQWKDLFSRFLITYYKVTSFAHSLYFYQHCTDSYFKIYVLYIYAIIDLTFLFLVRKKLVYLYIFHLYFSYTSSYVNFLVLPLLFSVEMCTNLDFTEVAFNGKVFSFVLFFHPCYMPWWGDCGSSPLLPSAPCWESTWQNSHYLELSPLYI